MYLIQNKGNTHITDCTFKDNSAAGDGGGGGAAVILF